MTAPPPHRGGGGLLLLRAQQLMPQMYCSLYAYCTTLFFRHFPLSPPGAPTSTTTREILAVKGRAVGKNWPVILPTMATSMPLQGSFTWRKSATWDRRLYFPSEGRRAEDLFALKNPTASAGCEPANLGTKGQHTTSRPPKPHNIRVLSAVKNLVGANKVKTSTSVPKPGLWFQQQTKGFLLDSIQWLEYTWGAWLKVQWNYF
jgi:hypothetical protein